MESLDLVESFRSFCGPRELVPLIEELVEGHVPFPESGNKVGECRDASGQSLNPLEIMYGTHSLDGLNLFFISLDPMVINHEAQ